MEKSFSGDGHSNAVSLPEPAKILLAEDSEGDVYLVKLALHDYGVNHTVRVLGDGELAWSAINELDKRPIAPPALMLLDLHLPKRDGLELLGHLRSRKYGRDLPVIVLTSSDSPNDRISAEQFEGVTFFRKPASLEEFMRLGGIAKTLIERQSGISEALSAGDSGIESGLERTGT